MVEDVAFVAEVGEDCSLDVGELLVFALAVARKYGGGAVGCFMVIDCIGLVVHDFDVLKLPRYSSLSGVRAGCC